MRKFSLSVNLPSRYVYRYLVPKWSKPHDGTDPLVTSDAEEATNETCNAVYQHQGQGSTGLSLDRLARLFGFPDVLRAVGTGVSDAFWVANNSCYLSCVLFTCVIIIT